MFSVTNIRHFVHQHLPIEGRVLQGIGVYLAACHTSISMGIPSPPHTHYILIIYIKADGGTSSRSNKERRKRRRLRSSLAAVWNVLASGHSPVHISYHFCIPKTTYMLTLLTCYHIDILWNGLSDSEALLGTEENEQESEKETMRVLSWWRWDDNEITVLQCEECYTVISPVMSAVWAIENHLNFAHKTTKRTGRKGESCGRKSSASLTNILWIPIKIQHLFWDSLHKRKAAVHQGKTSGDLWRPLIKYQWCIWRKQ